MAKSISLHKTSLQGFRESNEDAEKYNMNLLADGRPKNTKYAPVDFFVICDGHGGSSVSGCVVDSLEKHFMNKKLVYPLKHSYVKKIYNYIQNELINHPAKIAHYCGSTALVLVRYLDNDKKENIQVINLGDCRAILSRKGLPLPLSKDHKPIWPDEKHRIRKVNEKYNTDIQIHYDSGDWRIGDLSVSRSFGDLDNTPYVTHVPDSFNYALDFDDEFIVMGCDGLFDVLENHHIINFVRDHLVSNQIDLYDIPHKYNHKNYLSIKNIARKLAQYAIAKGSTDNVSVFIIFLN